MQHIVALKQAALHVLYSKIESKRLKHACLYSIIPSDLFGFFVDVNVHRQ